MITRRTLVRSALAAPAVLAGGSATAQERAWPSRYVRVVCPFAAGSSHDALTRILAEALAARLGQSFVVENVTGMGGSFGMGNAARAEPDGYTIGSGTIGTQAINQFLYKALPYDPERDFAPVSQFWQATNCLFVSAEKNPARDLQGFVAWAKGRPQGVTYGSSGIGTTPHLCGELFRLRTGINAIHVPYRDAGQRLINLVTGGLDFAIDSVPNYGPLLQDGKVRGLAVTSEARWPPLPDVPTMAEAGMPDFVVMSWGALYLPAKAPAAIADALGRAVREIAASPDFRKRYAAIGAQAAGSTPDELRATAARERALWSDVVARSGARVE